MLWYFRCPRCLRNVVQQWVRANWSFKDVTFCWLVVVFSYGRDWRISFDFDPIETPKPSWSLECSSFVFLILWFHFDRRCRWKYRAHCGDYPLVRRHLRLSTNFHALRPYQFDVLFHKWGLSSTFINVMCEYCYKTANELLLHSPSFTSHTWLSVVCHWPQSSSSDDQSSVLW